MIETSSRLLALLSLLQTRRDWPGGALAERLDVTSRTIRRDVDRLRELGYRIDAVKGPDGGYRLAAGSELPPLLLDDEQAVAIAVALQNAPASGADIADAAERALLTVRQVMPSRLRHRIDGVRFTGANAPVRVDPAVLEAVSEHVRLHRTLRFDYGAADHDAPARHAEPHGLVARDGRWYLVAWDVERGDWRVFRLDRLVPRIPSGPSFEPRAVPTGDVETFLSARFKGSTEADRWPCIGRFELDLPVREVTLWVGDGEVEALSDRSCRVTLGSWSWTGLLASILRFDAPFRIVEPPELVSAAEAMAARLAGAHGGGAAVTTPGRT
ncbi:helix-turn-helix transcriptional regulator [Leifsonia sp. NPDC058194]|uniref:helix-turn-helix transcriptional regulator n=1 Tax=Leifsonia sp. NPDC058194 TaxID=3346374 RepID=UPI0036DE8613